MKTTVYVTDDYKVHIFRGSINFINGQFLTELT